MTTHQAANRYKALLADLDHWNIACIAEHDRREAEIAAAFADLVAQGGSLPCEYDSTCSCPGRVLVHLKPCCDYHAGIHAAGFSAAGSALVECGFTVKQPSRKEIPDA